jgi:hypothetical protein
MKELTMFKILVQTYMVGGNSKVSQLVIEFDDKILADRAYEKLNITSRTNLRTVPTKLYVD